MAADTPTFPLSYGPNVVAYMPGGRASDVETEAEALLRRTRAATLVRVYPHASGGGTDAHIEGVELAGHLDTLRAREPGVVIARPGPRGPLDVVLGRGGPEAVLCNAVGAPVLFVRGSAYHERILLCVTDRAIDPGVADVALDLARLLGAPLVVLRAKLPSFLQAEEPATEAFVETVAGRARAHGVASEVRVLEGNPIAEWVRASTPRDLSVVARRRTRRDSFSSPDLGLRVARRSSGAVLVVTVAR
jgi:hypothetical protein